MRNPGAAKFCAISTALLSAIMWALGESTAGIIGFAVSGLSWVAVYLISERPAE